MTVPLLILAGGWKRKNDHHGSSDRLSAFRKKRSSSPPNPRHIVLHQSGAAQELKERVSGNGGFISRKPESKAGKAPLTRGLLVSATFHSLCARMLREFADQIRYGKNFTILDQSDQQDPDARDPEKDQSGRPGSSIPP